MIKNKSKKDLVYKYSGWTEYCKLGLKNRTFWFSKPGEFNDPFDCNIDVLDVESFSNTNLHDNPNLENVLRSIKESIKGSLSQMGVLCFTKPGSDIGKNGFDNMHFWSLYADNHKGISLGFNRELIDNMAEYLISVDGKLLDVNYRDGMFCFADNQSTNFLFNQPSFPKEFDHFITNEIVLRKDSKIWGNENECRIVLANNARLKLEKTQNSDTGYIIDYPQGDVLEEVTFGVKFNDAMGIEKVISFINKHHKNVKFYQAKLDYKTMSVTRKSILK